MEVCGGWGACGGQPLPGFLLQGKPSVKKREGVRKAEEREEKG